MKEYNSIIELLNDEGLYKGIHIECNHDTSSKVYEEFKKKFHGQNPCYILSTDRGYERYSIKSYLKLFEGLSCENTSYKYALSAFKLNDIQNKKLRDCSLSELMKINFARTSLFNGKIYFIEYPLLNLDSESLKIILNYICEKSEEGVKFITTNHSLRNALLMPGSVFYLDNKKYIEVEQDEEPTSSSEEELVVFKISAKSGTSTLLFEPKDIDYIESLNKANYISVRNSLYQVTQTMGTLEEQLKEFGFFRCHRSYIVNVQKVEEIEKLTKNSYSIRLNNEQHSHIPLSKGRIEDMKATFKW